MMEALERTLFMVHALRVNHESVIICSCQSVFPSVLLSFGWYKLVTEKYMIKNTEINLCRYRKTSHPLWRELIRLKEAFHSEAQVGKRQKREDHTPTRVPLLSPDNGPQFGQKGWQKSEGPQSDKKVRNFSVLRHT